MDKNAIRQLLEKYAAGTCTPAEEELVERMLTERPLFSDWEWENEHKKTEKKNEIKSLIDTEVSVVKSRKFPGYLLGGIAASIVFVFASILYLGMFHKEDEDETYRLASEESLDKDNIVLRLDDGDVFSLENLNTSELKITEDITLSDIDANGVRFNPADQSKPKHNPMLTVSVPPGKRFSLQLPDGSKVWLNTNSVLRFPSRFDSDMRVVYLEGEAYFEVLSDLDYPFKVVSQGTDIMATGTSFNVSGYGTDKAVVASLIEGTVNVHHENKQVLLNPGYAVSCTIGGNTTTPKMMDMEQVLAWKNGHFVFDDVTVVEALKAVARWYDVIIHVNRDVTQDVLGGSFSMDAPLEDLLSALQQLSKVNFKMNGNEIIVNP